MIHVKRLSERFKISNDNGKKITVELAECKDGMKVSIFGTYQSEILRFENSTPEMVREMGELIMEAGRLAEDATRLKLLRGEFLLRGKKKE